jgi:hypothetical protein
VRESIDIDVNKYIQKKKNWRDQLPIYFVLTHCVYPPIKLLTTPARPINPSSIKGRYPSDPAGIRASKISCVN